MFDANVFIDKILHSGIPKDEMLSRLNDIPPEALESQGEDFMLLAAMFASDAEIVPQMDGCASGQYQYPFADEFLTERVEETLEILRNNGFLENAGIIDRVRHCPICNGSHLNYIDVCPECKSLDFTKQELIHCFTCGRVAPSREFRRGMTLQCPFCDTRLRHLGSDYDFPLENYTCNSCAEIFIEPDVLVLCYSCGTRSKPDALLFKNINKLKLSGKGRLAVRLGRIDAEEKFVESDNYLSPDLFMRRANWLTMMQARYSAEIFSLLGLKFKKLDEISDALGSKRTMFMIDAIVKRIMELLRDTDILTRTVQGHMWFLLPRTDAPGVAAVAQKLKDIENLVSLPPDLKLGVETASHIFEGKQSGDFESVMKELASRLEGEM